MKVRQLVGQNSVFSPSNFRPFIEKVGPALEVYLQSNFGGQIFKSFDILFHPTALKW